MFFTNSSPSVRMKLEPKYSLHQVVHPSVQVKSFMERYLIFFILALIAEVLGTVSGFGSSILFVPIAALFFDFKIVLGITALSEKTV